MAKKAKSTLINMLLALTLIAFVASLALALVNKATEGPIAEVEKKKKADAIKKVLPDFVGEPVADSVMVEIDATKHDSAIFVRYTVCDAEGNMVGRAVETFDKNGFSGMLSAMVGFDAEGEITGYEIMASNETPGLGAKAGQWFQEGNKGSVIGKNLADALQVEKKDAPGYVDAITGSTITSRAFCRMVNVAYAAYLIEKGGNE